ncbi:FkbM family methyltransferase [Falsiruegeria mediterranea]|uniref:FkbM family methyltransferase n=1 Tax=Falsiruegeria mediterranea TaxID=1280832 RepID=UPI0015F29005|nr:FkbM family methyltransferase [Falsiruegeria mediterranea]
MHAFLRALEKQVLRGLGKGHGTKSISTEVNCIRKLLGKDRVGTCVDIGANVGLYTSALLRQFPDATVYSFEPSQFNVEKLKARFEGDTRVHIIPFAVSDCEGEANLYSNAPGSGLGSLLQRDLDYLNISFDQTEMVRTIRFDDFWTNEIGGRAIDILKLDIEGMELSALKGAEKALRNTRAVQFEFGGTNIDSRTYFKDFWSFFTEREFSLHRITPFGSLEIKRYSERDEVFTTTNYIAIAKSEAG